jgi:hypothetical protein
MKSRTSKKCGSKVLGLLRLCVCDSHLKRETRAELEVGGWRLELGGFSLLPAPLPRPLPAREISHLIQIAAP